MSLRALVVVALPLVPALSGGLFGCAAAPVVGTEPTVLWEDAAPPTSSTKIVLTPEEARRIAIAHDAAHTCEETARAVYRKDPERAWQVMRECVKRNDFGDLEILVEGMWAEEMAHDKDAALLFAHVIAVRGGDVSADLKLLRRRKMPVYSLQAALAEPEAYAGRMVLLRGLARRGHGHGSGRTFQLVETKVMAESEWVTAPGTTRLSTRSGNQLADQNGVDVKRGVVERNSKDATEKVEVLHNVTVETGLELTGRVDSDEPSLEPATDYVLVVRFDGIKDVTTEEGEADEEASATVVGYFEPENGMFARLGR